MIFSDRLRPARAPLWIGIFLIACVVGALVPFYASIIGESPYQLTALPAAILFAFLLAYSRTVLLLLLVFSRGATELLFESTRMSVGGIQIGLGGLINGFAILIAILLVLERPRLLSKDLVKVWAPFLVIAFIGTVFAPDHGQATRLFLQLMSEFAVFVGAFYLVRTDHDYRTCIKLILWSSVIPVVYGFIELANGGSPDFSGEGLRIRSTFSHPNILAFFLTLIISLTLYAAKSSSFALSQVQRAMLFAYILVLVILLLMTKTRSAWLACALMFLGYALLFERRYLVYLIMAGAVGIFIPGVGDRLLDAVQGNSISSATQLNSFEWRTSIWESGLQWMTPVHYVYGYGLEAFKDLAPTFFSEANRVNWGAHNVYVQLFFDLGLIGILAFFWMYFQLMDRIRRLFAFDRLGAYFSLFVIVEFLVVSASDNMLDYLSFNWYLWFLLGGSLSYAALHATARQLGKGPTIVQ
jgi:O-antigen ligase